jgi:hypothetical protein
VPAIVLDDDDAIVSGGSQALSRGRVSRGRFVDDPGPLVDPLPEVTGTGAEWPVYLLSPSWPDCGAMSEVRSRNPVASESVGVSVSRANCPGGRLVANGGKQFMGVDLRPSGAGEVRRVVVHEHAEVSECPDKAATL